MPSESVRRSAVADALCPIDALESRRLFATVNFSAGTLSIVGTDAAEAIFVVPKKGDPTSVQAVVDHVVVQTVLLSALTNVAIDGAGGSDTITVYHTLTASANVRGGEGNDLIHGGGGDDFLAGEKGDDSVFGGDGNDLITGGGQKNHLYGELGNDKIVGGNGRDYIFGGGGLDKLYGRLGNDNIYGEGGDDRLYGSSDNDFLDGGAGNDRMYGNSETDTLIGTRGRDTLIGGLNSGDDVAYTDGDDVLSQIEVVKH